jgi:hypothetical protein
MSGAAQWQTPQYPNGTSPMDVAPVMPGSVGTAWARDPLDLARAAMGARTPDAQYPDGYLGDVNSRRERLFTEVGSGPRDQRGVHKGERLAPQDYVWPVEFGPMSALVNQAETGQRYVPAGYLPVDPAHQASHSQVDRSALKTLAPRWSTGGPGIGTPVQPSGVAVVQ